jgi:hypothetical protein
LGIGKKDAMQLVTCDTSLGSPNHTSVGGMEDDSACAHNPAQIGVCEENVVEEGGGVGKGQSPVLSSVGGSQHGAISAHGPALVIVEKEYAFKVAERAWLKIPGFAAIGGMKNSALRSHGPPGAGIGEMDVPQVVALGQGVLPVPGGLSEKRDGDEQAEKKPLGESGKKGLFHGDRV